MTLGSNTFITEYLKNPTKNARLNNLVVRDCVLFLGTVQLAKVVLQPRKIILLNTGATMGLEYVNFIRNSRALNSYKVALTPFRIGEVEFPSISELHRRLNLEVQQYLSNKCSYLLDSTKSSTAREVYNSYKTLHQYYYKKSCTKVGMWFPKSDEERRELLKDKKYQLRVAQRYSMCK